MTSSSCPPLVHSLTHTHLHNGTNRPDVTLPLASDSRLTFQDCIPEVCLLLINSGNLQFGYLGEIITFKARTLYYFVFFMSYIKTIVSPPDFWCFKTFLIVFTQRRKAASFPNTRQTMTNPYSIINRLASGQQAFKLYT